jgi:hypothetical protein
VDGWSRAPGKGGHGQRDAGSIQRALQPIQHRFLFSLIGVVFGRLGYGGRVLAWSPSESFPKHLPLFSAVFGPFWAVLRRFATLCSP